MLAPAIKTHTILAAYFETQGLLVDFLEVQLGLQLVNARLYDILDVLSRNHFRLDIALLL